MIRIVSKKENRKVPAVRKSKSKDTNTFIFNYTKFISDIHFYTLDSSTRFICFGITEFIQWSQKVSVRWAQL